MGSRGCVERGSRSYSRVEQMSWEQVAWSIISALWLGIVAAIAWIVHREKVRGE